MLSFHFLLSESIPKPDTPPPDMTTLYNPWSEWQACSCANRHKKRTRTCLHGKEAQCATSKMVVEETERCDPGRCPGSEQSSADSAAHKEGDAYG